MLVYFCKWCSDSSLTKGKGRVPKNEGMFGFTVLCRSSSDAVKAAEWYFNSVYKNTLGLDFSDGVLQLSRVTLDSRNFTINYMMMDGIKRPVSLCNLKDSLTALTYNIY